MAIHSTAFGSVTLTEDDAEKFKRQVTYGRPKAEASATVRRGVKAAEEFRSSGRSLTLNLPAKTKK